MPTRRLGPVTKAEKRHADAELLRMFRQPPPRRDATGDSQRHRELVHASHDTEAREWLATPEHRVGTRSGRSSRSLVENVYRCGAVKAWLIDIDPLGQTAGGLVLELPRRREQRIRLFAWAGREARKQGFDPEVDIGQESIVVTFD